MHHDMQPKKPNMARFHNAFIGLGLNPEPYYQKLGIDPEIMHSNSGSISMGSYLNLLELAARSSNRRFLGMQMALEYDSTELGALSYILSNASDLESGIALLQRYIQLVSPGAKIKLALEKNFCTLRYQLDHFTPRLCQQDVEGTLTQFVLMIRTVLANSHWLPEQMYLQHANSDKTVIKNCPLACTLVFEHSFNGIRFDKKILGQSNQNFDPKLLALLENQIMQTAQGLLKNDTIIDKTRLLIATKLGNSPVTADNIAFELGMSRRTFYRRLKVHNLTYNRLREEVIINLAKQSLESSSIAITQLALNLGYSEASAFDRAFKRITRQSPMEYRAQHRQN